MMRNWVPICRLHRRASCIRSVSSSYRFTEARTSAPIAVSSANGTPERPFPTVSSLSSSPQFHPSNHSPQCPRSFCSSSAGPSNIVLVKSEEDMNTSLNKAQDGSLPAIFYFTAVWCGPCRFIAPVIEELSTRYPPVTIYKIDIDEESLERILGGLNITSVFLKRMVLCLPRFMFVWIMKSWIKANSQASFLHGYMPYCLVNSYIFHNPSKLISMIAAI